jgi:hypothetical protein
MLSLSARSTPLAALVALSIVAGLPASHAQAAQVVIPAGTIHSRPVSADGSLRTFSGKVTPFGPIAGKLALQVDPMSGAFTGEFLFHAPAGTAYGTIQGQFTSESTYVERLTFVGGTGKYAGISGYADVTGSLNPNNGTGVDTVTGGQIYLP